VRQGMVRALGSMSLASFIVGCASDVRRDYVVRDAKSAISIGVDACTSKNVVRSSSSQMHAVLEHGVWHVRLEDRNCPGVSMEVDALTGMVGDCHVCVIAT
jgi:hypothetical protein